MQFPQMTEIKPGDQLKADGGFTCLRDGEIVSVMSDEDGRNYVPCSEGRHYLHGQKGKDGECVGLYRA